jgi:flavin reductase (DIM6/NTAB) family NADH-FMN oxidoreductase RutF
MKKVAFPIDKRKWSPSLVPGGIVLISTLSQSKEPHFAPKSWVQMVSFEPPILVFSGSEGQATENNVLLNREFVANIVDDAIADRAFESIEWRGSERVKNSGFTFGPSTSVAPPLVNECKAHLECRLLDTKAIGSGFLIFGEIVAASIWDKIMGEEERDKRYQLLRQSVFQENGVVSALDSIRAVR